MKSAHSIIFRDSRDMPEIADESVQLVVTSPPYPMIEMWDETFAKMNPEIDAQDGPEAWRLMHEELDKVWMEVYRVLAPGCFACVNIGDATRSVSGEFALYPNHARIVQSMLELGFTMLPDVIWRKPTNAPNKFMGSGMLPAGAYVTFEHEYILVFRKGAMRKFDDAGKQRRRESAYFWEERNLWFSDVWTDLIGARQGMDSEARKRSAAFPFELPWRLINMFSLYEDTVLDPFLGLGTTTLAAMTSARNSIGVEIDESLRDGIDAALAAVTFVSQSRARKRIEDHLGFVRARCDSGKPLKYVNRPHGFEVITRQEMDLRLVEAVSLSQDQRGGYEAWYKPASLKIEMEDQ
ncbi:MAG: site-specific DNA-methyltransferase [Planctomycetes bacterium]|nr:site-specific DNA-methyltransferase [Planctomycetota bacterium]